MNKPYNQITSIKSLEELREYLDKNKDINLTALVDKNNTTLLHVAAFKNDLPRLKLFIKHYKQFAETNHGAGFNKSVNSFANMLKAWVNSPNSQGYVPILYAALHGNMSMIQFLQECGSNMHFRTTKSQNILFMCIENNAIKCLIYLLQSDLHYNINQQNYKNQTILHHACAKGYTQMVSYILSMGADIQVKNSEEQTPLLVATRESKREVIKILLLKGADRHAVNKNGENSLKIARDNNKQQMVKILNDEYTFMDKVKIKCNKKLVYQPEEPSYRFSIYFALLFHLFFVPINVISEFNIDKRYQKIIPFVLLGFYQLLIIIIYISLFSKPKRKRPIKLQQISGKFCADCKRCINQKMFHCHICARCVNRYDHHCPWINNCVGAHNIGRFTVFLFLLMVGLAEVLFCCVFLILGDKVGKQFVHYRSEIQIPDAIHFPLNILIILFSGLLLFGIFNLFIGQVHNLLTNSTGIQRQRKNRSTNKSSLMSSSDTSLLDTSMQQQSEELQIRKGCNCLSNCCEMLSEDN